MSLPADINDRYVAAAIKAEGASEIMRRFSNDPSGTYIDTESGPLPSLSEWLAINAAALGGVPALQGFITDLQNRVDPLKGSKLLGFKRSPLAGAVETVGDYLSAQWVSLWEFAGHVVTKPNPLDPSTWDWSPAMQAAINSFPLNPADPGIHTPKGFANGGCLHVPRGRFPLYSKVNLRRGVRIVGDSRESTQFISFITSDSVFQYLDAGRYLQDEISFEHLSIWQDPSVLATAGAAIDVIEGPATVDSVYLRICSVIIEGTYHGIRLAAGVGCSVRESNVTKCVAYGFWQTGSVSTTSTVLESTYFHQCGGNGVQIDAAAYVALVSVASDSNGGSGYKITGKCVQLVGCGAEGNSGTGANIVGSGSVSLGLFTIANGSHAVSVATTTQVTLLGCDLDGTAGFGVSHDGSARITSVGTTWRGAYAAAKFSSAVNVLELGAAGGLVGGGLNQWAIGATPQPEPDTTLAVSGSAAAATRNGFKSVVTHTAAGTRNVATWSQFISANTSVTYSLVVGDFIPNASKGAAATHERSAGSFIVEQTTGTTANANLIIDAGAGTVPAGNWNMYCDSTRHNVLGGPLRVGPLKSTAPFLTSGAGSPEGVLVAPVGSIYMRSDGGAGTSHYVKETGAGNTGWVAK